MKTSSALLTLGSAAMVAGLQQCTGSAKDEGGNWFCGAVDQILYSNVGHPGTYKAVSHMGSDGSCNFEDKAFTGPLAPFNEELALILRGPLELDRLDVYNIVEKKQKRDAGVPQSQIHARRHFHGHHHLHKKHAQEKRGEDWITATIDGQVVSWINTYHGATDVPSTEPAAEEKPAPAEKPAAPEVQAQALKEYPEPTTTSVAPRPTPTKSTPENVATGDYTRIAHYDADKGVADGLVFLGNYGGDGSGVFDTVWGNSLSYINSKATGGSPSPQVLEKVLIPSNKEFAIYSDKPCTDGSCGYVRPGSVAYHGFGGESKVFLMRFSMPLDGSSGFNADMPAAWLLNAKIPRTQQYGDCSCWQTDCGEFDILEVLAPGDTKCKSTFHTNVNGGSSDYFKRPTDGFINVATVFDAASGQVSVKILGDNVDFATSLSEDLVQSWIQTGKDNSLFSLFSLAS
ncbi:target of Sbf [Verticillium nonalfalfae]|uniref:glucan endo-1,3-beta-D-glucosidase n=1 Tax=Verticillium nonalfalfae TaxID=1051616 RepID=A0A3M9Y3M4_9PEZI|nr:target of Sbf [Verticillium nonalfalfae]RNJ55037.1 target of Sbf [Verticillium nonalfalfae]